MSENSCPEVADRGSVNQQPCMNGEVSQKAKIWVKCTHRQGKTDAMDQRLNHRGAGTYMKEKQAEVSGTKPQIWQKRQKKSDKKGENIFQIHSPSSKNRCCGSDIDPQRCRGLHERKTGRSQWNSTQNKTKKAKKKFKKANIYSKSTHCPAQTDEMDQILTHRGAGTSDT
jgi:hypothetical protein